MKNEEVKEKNTKKGTTSKGKATKKSETTTKKQVSKSTTKKSTDNKKTTSKTASKTTPKEKVVKEVVVEEKIEKKEVKEEKTTNAVKNKSDLILILGLVVVVVLGFVLMKGEKVEPGYELPLTLSGEAGLHQLTYQEYQEKIDNDEEFVVILERATCSHCVTYMPIAEEFANENGVPMYYVDTDTFTSDDWTTFENSNSFLKKSNGNWGTPTTIVLAGSEAVDYIEGTTDATSLLELYNEYFDMEKE